MIHGAGSTSPETSRSNARRMSAGAAPQLVYTVSSRVKSDHQSTGTGVPAGGGDVKDLLAADGVRVNGEPEARRGRQLHPGDTVEAGGQQLVVVARGRAKDDAHEH